MLQTSPLARGLLLALPMTFSTAIAVAAPQAEDAAADLQRVEVSGRRPGELTRFDVTTAGPGIAASLQDAMAYTVYQMAESGTTRVHFRVKGDGTSEVKASGGPLSYRQPLRRAMHTVSCSDKEEGQLFSFLIKFSLEDEAPGTDKRNVVALLEQ